MFLHNLYINFFIITISKKRCIFMSQILKSLYVLFT